MEVVDQKRVLRLRRELDLALDRELDRCSESSPFRQ
jgi:hypothetical protein